MEVNLRRALVLLAVLALGVAYVLLLAQDGEPVKIRSPIAADDARHATYMARLLGTAVTRGNQFDVLINGDEIFPPMLDAIRTAQRRINFETYVYKVGKVSDQFTEALTQAAARGVRVNLVIDSVGATDMDRAHVARLLEAGRRVATFNSPRWYLPEEINYRTHRKILVVDGEVGFTGGVGVADYWLGNAQSAEHWRDTQFRIRGPIVSQLDSAFYENFIEAAGEVTLDLDDAPAALDTEGASFLVRGSLARGSNDLKRLYLLSIASARRTLDITTPYFVMDESSEWAFEDAVRRGVKIRILMEGDITDAKPVKYVSRSAYEGLLNLGIELYEYQPTMMHAKTLIVDGIWSVFGSANFDNRSLELNDELNIAVSSRDLAARLRADFDRDLRSSKRIDREEWRRRSLLHKTREKLWVYFGEVF